jgi:hypothetical protein
MTQTAVGSCRCCAHLTVLPRLLGIEEKLPKHEGSEQTTNFLSVSDPSTQSICNFWPRSASSKESEHRGKCFKIIDRCFLVLPKCDRDQNYLEIIPCWGSGGHCSNLGKYVELRRVWT